MIDKKAMYNIGYGLYVITANDGNKDTGCIANSVIQAADKPQRIVVCINKANYTNEVVNRTGTLNINCLTVGTPFEVFRHFGFQSGRDTDKFADTADTAPRSVNGLIYLPENINSYMSLKVEKTVDMGSHDMFICEIVEAKTVSDAESMTYAYYQSNVKPRTSAQTGTKKVRWVCSVCGYVHEADELPEDFICPVCKHDASAFEKIL